MSQAGETVLVEREAAVLRVTLNRPERLNAFAGDMRDRLAEAIETGSADREVRVVVITGSGRGFCAGADVDVMAGLLEKGDEETFAGYVEAGARVARAIHRSEKPVIAALNGVAAGAGASLAVACHFRVASERATIGFTFNRIGLHPDWGATFHLPRLVGHGRAAELILDARMLQSAEADRLGLFERVVPAAAFPATVTGLAEELAAKPPLAVSRFLRNLRHPGSARELEEALGREAEAQMECFRSRDVREGIAAFRERRAPVFTGE